MEARNLVRRYNKIQMVLHFSAYNTYATLLSPEFVINGLATFQVKVIVVRYNNQSTYSNLIFIKFFKVHPEDELTYKLNFTSKALEIADKVLICDDGTWHLINENKKQELSFDVSVVMNMVRVCSFASLYSDTDLADFELRGEDGSVQMHRAALAASSPVLQKMLSGKWREATEGHVEIPGTSQKTLQHLKDYIYLQTLPETGLEQILLLASYYMIPDLEQRCINKLMNCLTARNVVDLLEFAVKEKITKLLLAILECVVYGTVAVKDVRKHLGLHYFVKS